MGPEGASHGLHLKLCGCDVVQFVDTGDRHKEVEGVLLASLTLAVPNQEE